MEEPDMTDPKVLEKACAEWAEGMRKQAEASDMNSAQGGHPYPHFFFGQAAAVFAAVAEYLKKVNAPAPAPAPDKQHKK